MQTADFFLTSANAVSGQLQFGDHPFITDKLGLFNLGSVTSFLTYNLCGRGNTMKLSISSYYAQISVAVVLLGVLSITESGSVAPADEHAVLVDNIGTYGRKIRQSRIYSVMGCSSKKCGSTLGASAGRSPVNGLLRKVFAFDEFPYVLARPLCTCRSSPNGHYRDTV